MKLFGQLVRTMVNVPLVAVAVAQDIVTAGGVFTDQDPATPKALEQLKREAQEDDDDE